MIRCISSYLFFAPLHLTWRFDAWLSHRVPQLIEAYQRMGAEGPTGVEMALVVRPSVAEWGSAGGRSGAFSGGGGAGGGEDPIRFTSDAEAKAEWKPLAMLRLLFHRFPHAVWFAKVTACTSHKSPPSRFTFQRAIIGHMLFSVRPFRPLNLKSGAKRKTSPLIEAPTALHLYCYQVDSDSFLRPLHFRAALATYDPATPLYLGSPGEFHGWLDSPIEVRSIQSMEGQNKAQRLK